MYYNKWIAELLARSPPRHTGILLSIHAVNEGIIDGIDEHDIRMAIRDGAIVVGKCVYPDKVCFQRYDGKKNRTCVVVTQFKESVIVVVTVWAIEGR